MSSTSSTQPIRFFHRGQIVDVSGVHPTRTVLDWLRPAIPVRSMA